MKDVDLLRNENPTDMSEGKKCHHKQFVVDNGGLIACRDDSSIYLVQRGQRYLIPSLDIFDDEHDGLVNFIEKNQMNSIPIGDPLSKDTCLIKGSQTESVYLCYNNGKSHIRSAEDFKRAGFNWKAIRTLPQEDVDNINILRDFVVEEGRKIVIKANEIPDDYADDNNYGFLTDFTCKFDKRVVKCNVLLPGKNCEKEYPVLYLYHGLGDNAEWIDPALGRIQHIIGNMVRKGLIPEMIVVMPDILYSGAGSKPYDFYRFQASLKEVMSYVEHKYKVKNGKENTAIAGLSLGGTTALYNAYLFKDTFQYIGAFCPTSVLLYQPSKGIMEPWIPKDQDFVLGTGFDDFTFIANGMTDRSAAETPEFYSRVLRENGTDNVFALLPDGDHCWDTFRKLFYKFMAFDFFRKR